MRILILNGPNLNLLGNRETDVYGPQTLEQIMKALRDYAETRQIQLEMLQSNSEGELVSAIGSAQTDFDGIIINPAAYTHTSIALRDAIKAVDIPCVEVHLSNTHSRESFRQTSMTAPVCLAQLQGFGGMGYQLALEGLVEWIRRGEAYT